MTRVKSERHAELGRRAAAGLERDPVTKRFVRKAGGPLAPPLDPAGTTQPPPLARPPDPTPAPPDPTYPEARRSWNPLRRRRSS